MHKKKAFVFVLLGLFFLVLGGLGGALLYFGKTEKTASVCANISGYTVYKMSIRNDTFDPGHIDAHLCDRLQVTNYDDKLRIIAFGEHEDHNAYDGILERTLKTNGTFEVTFDQTGSFVLHDHLEESVAGSFSVVPRTD